MPSSVTLPSALGREPPLCFCPLGIGHAEETSFPEGKEGTAQAKASVLLGHSGGGREESLCQQKWPYRFGGFLSFFFFKLKSGTQVAQDDLELLFLQFLLPKY